MFLASSADSIRPISQKDELLHLFASVHGPNTPTPVGTAPQVLSDLEASRSNRRLQDRMDPVSQALFSAEDV